MSSPDLEDFTEENGEAEENTNTSSSTSEISEQSGATERRKLITASWRIITITIIHGIISSLFITIGTILVKTEKIFASSSNTTSREPNRFQEPLHTFCFSFVCSTHLPFLCILTGIVISFVAYSTGIQAIRRGNSCCHVTWVSISALSAVCLAVMMIVGVDDVDSSQEKGCMFAVVSGCIVELITCAIDICLFNQHVMSEEGIIKKRTEERLASVASVQTVLETEEENPIYANTSAQTPTILVSEESRRRIRRDSNRSREATRRERRPSRGQGTGVRLSTGRMRRDRSLLYPSHSNRQRTRRRPMLRGQNHYISIPVSYSVASETHVAGSGVTSTANRAQRPAQGLPMFIITDCHPAPPLDLQNAETRVKCPTPSSAHRNIETELENTNRLLNTAITSQHSNDREITKIEVTASTTPSLDIPTAASVTEEVKHDTAMLRKKMKNGAVYSIVRRSKEGSLTDGNGDQSSSQVFDGATDSNCNDCKICDDPSEGAGVEDQITAIKIRGSCDEEKITIFEGLEEQTEKETRNNSPTNESETKLKKKLPNYENIGLTSDAPKLPPRS